MYLTIFSTPLSVEFMPSVEIVPCVTGFQYIITRNAKTLLERGTKKIMRYNARIAY
jgi:hypothetical protein